MSKLATTPQPPYYAVIFTSLPASNQEGYAETAARMEALAKQQPGYLGLEHARANIAVTVSYWESLEAIKAWKMNAEHAAARAKGRSTWYADFKLRVCLVEKEYGMNG